MYVYIRNTHTYTYTHTHTHRNKNRTQLHKFIHPSEQPKISSKFYIPHPHNHPHNHSWMRKDTTTTTTTTPSPTLTLILWPSSRTPRSKILAVIFPPVISSSSGTKERVEAEVEADVEVDVVGPCCPPLPSSTDDISQSTPLSAMSCVCPVLPFCHPRANIWLIRLRKGG